MDASDIDAGALGEGDAGDDLEAQRLLARVRERLVGVTSEPVRVGRYELRTKLGAGAAGVVYEAVDPELDRHLAIKLIEADDDVLAARFIREARALADLSHPNVVQIYDAGIAAQRVFIAMELVEGETLGDWLAAHEPKPAEIVRLFDGAGRGLAAAHQRGIVHRDFKPANVLVSHDGRPRVSDFGLAREVSRGDEHGATLTDGLIPVTSAESLTQTGAVLGTPAYMAPEQAQGQAIDARADQFSFCVALFEALVGRRPFAGKTLQALVEAVAHGVTRIDERALPAPFRKAIVRGLAAKPADRHPDMESLLRALRASGSTAATWVLLGAGATIVVGGAATFAGGQDAQSCNATGIDVQRRWTEVQRGAVATAFARSGAREADATWARIGPRIDLYVETWVDARAQACSLPPEAEHLDRTRWCLKGRRRRLQALVDQLVVADAAIVRAATEATDALRDPGSCLDKSYVAAAAPPPPPELRAAVDEVLQRLMSGRTATNVGDDAQALTHYMAAAASAEELGYGPLLAEALADYGRARAVDDPDQGIETLERAHGLAIEHGRHDAALRAAVGLVWTHGMLKEHPDDAEIWVRHAQASLRRRDHEPADEMLVLNARASLASVQGKYGDAVELYEALVAAQSSLGMSNLRLAMARRNLGRALLYAGRTDGAREQLEEALEVAVAAVGESHPIVGAIHQAMAGVAWGQQRLDDAEEGFAKAAVIHEAVHAWGDLANDVGGLASVAQVRLRYDEAIAQHLRAVELHERAHGPEHPNVARQLDNYSTALQASGRLDEAETALRRSQSIKETALGREHRDVGLTHVHLGTLAELRGATDVAQTEFERALEILRVQAGPDHPLTAEAWSGLSRAQLAQGRFPQAIASAERGLKIFTAASAFPSQIADVESTLAGALAGAQGGTCRGSEDARCARARTLAHSAREKYVALGPALQTQVSALDQWIAATL